MTSKVTSPSRPYGMQRCHEESRVWLQGALDASTVLQVAEIHETRYILFFFNSLSLWNSICCQNTMFIWCKNHHLQISMFSPKFNGPWRGWSVLVWRLSFQFWFVTSNRGLIGCYDYVNKDSILFFVPLLQTISNIYPCLFLLISQCMGHPPGRCSSYILLCC